LGSCGSTLINISHVAPPTGEDRQHAAADPERRPDGRESTGRGGDAAAGR